MLNRVIKWSLYSLVFLLPLFFLPFSFEKFELNKLYLLFFLVSLAFLAWFSKMVIFDKQIKLRKSPLDIFVLAFFFVALIGAIFSADKLSSFLGFYGRFPNSLIGLFSFCLFYFLITNNVSNKKESPISVQSIFKAFFGSAFLAVLISYFSIFGIFGKINSFLGFLPESILGFGFNTITASMEGLAVFLAVVLVFLIGKITFFNEKSKTCRIFNYLLLSAVVFLMVIIDFNNAWLMVLLSLIMFLIFAFWKRTFKEDANKLLLPILFVILSASFLFISTFGIQKAILGSSLPQEKFLNQEDSWLIGLKSATESVKSGFFGSGIGTFHYEFSKFKPLSFNQSDLWQLRIDRPGNHFAEILGTTGFLGIISYTLLIGLLILLSFLFFGKNKNSTILFMVFLSLIFSQLFYYQNITLAFVFWLVLGLSAVSWRGESEKEKTISFKDFPELSLIMSILLIVVVLLFLTAFFFMARFYLADINYKKGLEKSSIELVEKAVELNPYQPQYGIVASRYYLQKTNLLIEENSFEESQLICNASLALAHAKGGDVLELCLKAGAAPDSVISIKGVEKNSPNKVIVQETLGMIYRDFKGMMDEQEGFKWGLYHFEKAVGLEPTNPVLRVELGKLYFLANNIEKAKECFIKAKELKPDYSEPSIHLALLSEESDAKEAIRQMEDLAASFSSDAEVLFQLGRLYLNNNEIDKAIIQFEKAVKIFPEHSNSLYSLGLAYQKKGQTDKALSYYNKVLELNPGNSDVISKISSLSQTAE